MIVGALSSNRDYGTNYLLVSELTKSLFDTVQLVEHYAAAAYCPDNTAGPNTTTRIACAKSNNCQKVESALTSIVVRMNEYVSSSLRNQQALAD